MFADLSSGNIFFCKTGRKGNICLLVVPGVPRVNFVE